jgi:chemotaxis protein methyltransferase CheR
MTPQNHAAIAELLKKRSGLVLGAEKSYLLESRLSPLAKKHKLANLDDLVTALTKDPNGALATKVVEAMTTNESLFFRDSRPFEQLKKTLLPALAKARGATRSLRVWSAACSHGQEPYSIAMTIKEMGPLFAGWKIEILATDIAQEVMARAKSGLFTQFEVQRGLPVTLLVKYFAKSGTRWQVDAGIRAMVNFKEFNLLGDMRSLGQFDLIFCRNVLIYFDPPTKRKVLDGLAQRLVPDGALFLGGAETVLGLTEAVAPVPNERGLYMKPGEAGAAAKPKGAAATG